MPEGAHRLQARPCEVRTVASMMASPIAPGTLVNERYLLTEPAPDRGLGANWSAQDLAMKGRVVAVKLLREQPTAQMPEALAKHLGALRPVRHKRLLTVLNQGMWGRRPYVVHEAFAGRSLGTGIDEVRASGQLVELPLLQRSFDQVCEAVLACHQAPTPVLHLGLNPGCVLMHRQPKKDFEVKLLDVGLHRWADRDASAPARSARALTNPAPELFGTGDEATVRTDVFALGALLRELISLPASAGETLAVAGLHRRRDDVPGEVWEAIERCVALDPAARLPDVAALRAALDVAWSRPLQRRPPARSQPPTPELPQREPSVFERLRAMEADAPAPAPGLTLMRASEPNPWDVAEVPGDPFAEQINYATPVSAKAARLEAMFGASSADAAGFDAGATILSGPPVVEGIEPNATVLSMGRSPFAVSEAPRRSAPEFDGTLIAQVRPLPPRAASVPVVTLPQSPPVSPSADPTDGTLIATPPRLTQPNRPLPPREPVVPPVAPRASWLPWALGVAAVVIAFVTAFVLARH